VTNDLLSNAPKKPPFQLTSAMIGADYGVLANGRWAMTKSVQDMLDWLEFKLQSEPERAK